jgi:hypothetical protein
LRDQPDRRRGILAVRGRLAEVQIADDIAFVGHVRAFLQELRFFPAGA